MTDERPLHEIPDDELLHRLAQLTQSSRRVEAELVAHIGEVDERRLYAREASPSMFVYCTDVLHLSEAEAYLRITVARAAREHPILLTMLGDGRLHLSGTVRLVPHLTRENRELLLERATHRSKRAILELLAELFPRPDAPTLIRKLPARRVIPGSSDALVGRELELSPGGVARSGDTTPTLPALIPAPASSALVEPLAPARYKVQFTASAELHDKLERLRALMRSKVPDGDLAALIEEAVTEKLERLEARRFGSTRAPRNQVATSDTSPGSRHIPAAVKRVVSEREGRRCAYEDKRGRRCRARERLEYHHRHPFGHGGDRGIENIVLVCQTHNEFLAEHDYGRRTLATRRHVAERHCEGSARSSP